MGLTYLGLATNLFIIVYTSDMCGRYWPEFTTLEVFFVVVLLEHVLIALKLMIDYLVPDVPASVRISLARYSPNQLLNFITY